MKLSQNKTKPTGRNGDLRVQFSPGAAQNKVAQPLSTSKGNGEKYLDYYLYHHDSTSKGNGFDRDRVDIGES